MTTKERLKAIGGFLAIVTLLGLVAADTLLTSVTFYIYDKVLIVTLITALLGVDMALETLPKLQISLIESDSGDEDNDD